MIKFSLAIIATLLIISCNSNISNNSNITIKRLQYPDSVAISFLKWYKTNYKKIEKFYAMSAKNDSSYLINGKCGDSTFYYSVNFKGTVKFLELLKSSKCLSDKYLNVLRQSFSDRNNVLISKKQFDGPPDGFSADEVFMTNDIEELLNLLETTDQSEKLWSKIKIFNFIS